MDNYTFSPEFTEKLDIFIEKTMNTLGAFSISWFSLYIIVSFINNFS